MQSDVSGVDGERLHVGGGLKLIYSRASLHVLTLASVHLKKPRDVVVVQVSIVLPVNLYPKGTQSGNQESAL